MGDYHIICGELPRSKRFPICTGGKAAGGKEGKLVTCWSAVRCRYCDSDAVSEKCDNKFLGIKYVTGSGIAKDYFSVDRTQIFMFVKNLCY